MTLNVFAYETRENIAVLNDHFHVLFTKNDTDHLKVNKLTPFLFRRSNYLQYFTSVSERTWLDTDTV